MVRMAEALRIFALIQLGPQGYCSSFLAAHVERAKTTLAEYDRADHLSGPAVAGWKLVPVEPTEAMIDGWCMCGRLPIQDGKEWTRYINAYKAMLAAAPSSTADVAEARWMPISSAPKDGTWIIGAYFCRDNTHAPLRLHSVDRMRWVSKRSLWQNQFCDMDEGYAPQYWISATAPDPVSHTTGACEKREHPIDLKPR